MVKKLDMFEFGGYEEAVERGGKKPTTTKWVENKKIDDDGNEFVRCRLVARDFKQRCEGPRDDLFASMPPLEALKVMLAMVAVGLWAAQAACASTNNLWLTHMFLATAIRAWGLTPRRKVS